jgi:hypothetical protein
MQFRIWYWMYYNNIKKDRIFFFRRKSTKSIVTLLRRRAQEKDNIHSCNNSCLFSPTSTPLNVLRKNGLSFLTITLLQHFLEKQTFWFLSFYLSLIAFEKGFESIYFISYRYHFWNKLNLNIQKILTVWQLGICVQWSFFQIEYNDFLYTFGCTIDIFTTEKHPTRHRRKFNINSINQKWRLTISETAFVSTHSIDKRRDQLCCLYDS